MRETLLALHAEGMTVQEAAQSLLWSVRRTASNREMAKYEVVGVD